MYSGDEFYDDETTSGLDERPRRWEHIRQPRRDHDAEPPNLPPRTICRRCGLPIRRVPA